MRSDEARRIIWVGVLLACLAGIVVSALLSQKHIHQGIGENSFMSRQCAEEGAGCDEVLRSRWGSVLGVPTAVWGLTYFAGIGLWYVLVGLPNRAGRAWQLVPIGATAVGVAIAAALARYMFVVLPTWCPYCTTTHVLSLLLFVGSILLWPRAPKPSAAARAAADAGGAARPGAQRAALAVVAILIASWGIQENFQHRRYRAEFAAAEEVERTLAEAGVGATRSPRTGGSASTTQAGPEDCDDVRDELAACKAQLEPFLQDWQALVNQMGGQTPVQFALRGDDPYRGTLTPRHNVVVFSDFDCPNCAGFYAYWLYQVEPWVKGTTRFVYRHFPMNTACNPLVKRTLYPQACEAAIAAEAARLQGGNDAFWKMGEELFKNQLRKDRLSYAELATRAGLDGQRLTQDMVQRRAQLMERIQQDLSFAQQAGVDGTPTVFVDGLKMPVWQRDRLWEFLLKFKKTDTPPAPTTAPGS